MADLSGRTFGPYQIVEPLGEGGMAIVYKAYQPAMDRYVAFKVLPQDLAQEAEFVGRFQQEARLLAGLQHPHILPIFDFGERGGVTYIVMPYIKTGTLQDRLDGHWLQIERAVRITAQVGEALDYAHSHGLIHRDVKPSNILLDERDNSLLTDFGIAKLFEATTGFTSTGGIIGTPAYMSPEQGQGEKVDYRTDIYSLGVVLYEMVTGRVPFDAETPIAVVLKHITDPLPEPRKINPQIPLVVQRVILKATAKDPAHRFDSAGAMARALQSGDAETVILHQPDQDAAVLEVASAHSTNDGEPLSRRSPGAMPRKWLLVAGALLLLFVLSVGAGALAVWQAREANETVRDTDSVRTPAVSSEQDAVDIEVPTAFPTDAAESQALAGPAPASLQDDEGAFRVEIDVPGDVSRTEALDVRAGQRLRVEVVGGSWSAGPPSAWPLVGPEGDAQVSTKASFPVPSAPLMALVAGVGDGDPFVVPVGQARTLAHDGLLWLGPNDDDTGDNSGTLSIEIFLEDAPEVASEPSSTPRPLATPRPSRTPTITPTAAPLGPENIVLGQSAGGLPIEAVRFGNGPNTVVFVGGIHAGFAPVAVTLAQNTIQHFTENPDDVPASATVYVIRSMNPDSEYDPGFLPGRLNDNGVDLNRNWNCAWAQSPRIDDRIVSGAGGPEPFSEPETRAVSDFLVEKDARAVVFWEARAVPGIVMPGACGPTSEVSNPLALTYARPTGYRWAVVENFSDIGVNGDASNWLDLQGIPAAFVLLPSFTDPAWDRDLPGILAVVRQYGR